MPFRGPGSLLCDLVQPIAASVAATSTIGRALDRPRWLLPTKVAADADMLGYALLTKTQSGPEKPSTTIKSVLCSSVPYGCRTGPICGTRTGLAMP
jgi:hypothetical protein